MSKEIITAIRDRDICIPKELYAQFRVIAEIEDLHTAEEAICKVLDAYVQGKYGDKIQKALDGASKAYRLAMKALEDDLKPKLSLSPLQAP